VTTAPKRWWREPADTAALKALQRERRENGVEIDEFDADELRQLEPALSRDYVRGVLVRENGHTSNPLKLVKRLLGHFLRSSGEIVHARAHGFRLDGHRLAVIQTDSGDHAADAAIVCAGAYSKPLAAALCNWVPLETERGYHLMIADPEVMPRIPTADADGKFVATPMDTGLRFAGTVELAGLAAPLIGGAPASYLRRAARCCPICPRPIRKSGSRCGWAIGRACRTRCRCSVGRGPRRTSSTPSATAMSG